MSIGFRKYLVVFFIGYWNQFENHSFITLVHLYNNIRAYIQFMILQTLLTNYIKKSFPLGNIFNINNIPVWVTLIK